MKVHLDTGTGRSFVVVLDNQSYIDLALAVAERLASRVRAIVIESPAVTGDSWRRLAQDFQALLDSLKIRQASFVGLAAGATLVHNLTLENPKGVRTHVVVDASLRAHPSRFERALDAIEERLPFGLPLRLGAKSFNVRAFAHRLRCPLLLVSTKRAGRFISSELRALGCIAPTAWYVDLSGETLSDEASFLAELVMKFQETPAKCPQKNLLG
jgi:pimeloyl-ACP methyl ester carboxylesterase